MGLCQRLEHISRMQKDESLQKSAVEFLGDLVKGPHWKRYERIEQMVYQALSRLRTTPSLSLSIQEQAKKLLEQEPLTAQSGPIEEAAYIAPVWDPAWRRVGTQLLCQARGDEGCVIALNSVLQGDRKPLALLGKDIGKLEAQYMQSLKADEFKEALEVYIAPQGKLSIRSTEHFDLEKRVDTFLESEKKVLLLLGEGGSGKSTFNRHLTRRLWKEYTSAEHHADRPIPLFIPLASLDNPGKNLIEQYLKEQDLSDPQIEALHKDRRFIFILDGYDEIAHRSQAFYEKNKLDRWQAQVIISSRPEYLGANYQHKFHPPGSPSLLEECWLVGFSNEQIEDYIDKYVVCSKPQWSAQQYKEAFKELSELKELVRTPFMLKMTLGVLPELKAKGNNLKLTRIRLYQKFVENWLNRSQERLGRIQLIEEERKVFDRLNEEGFTSHGWVYSQNLALAMYEEQLVSVTYSEAKDGKKKDWRSLYLGNAEEKTWLLRFNAPLTRQADQYRFIHKSIQDYLVARAICEDLENPAQSLEDGAPLNWIPNIHQLWEDLDPSVQMDPRTLLNRFNLVEDAAIQRFLIECVKQNGELVKPLLAWIKASKTEEGVSQGAANVITILVGAGVQFNEMDLKNIRIPGADLSFGVLDSAQLQGADLRKVTLRASWLRQANLSGAQKAGMRFGEWAYLEEEGPVYSCAYSPDGKTCAIGLELKNGNIRLYDTSSWAKIHTLEGLEGDVMSVAYSPNGAQIASGGEDHTVRLWDAGSGTLQHTLKGHEGQVWSVVYSPNGAQIASGSWDRMVRLWDAGSGTLQHTLKGHEGHVWSVAYSPNGAQIVSGSWDRTVRLWDSGSGALQHTLKGHQMHVYSTAYLPNGTQIASGSEDNTVRLWDVGSGALQQNLESHVCKVISVAYSPDGAQIASSSQDETIRLWDAGSGALQYTLKCRGSVHSIAYSPDGAQIASVSWNSSGCTKLLWDAGSGVLQHTLDDHEYQITSIAYSPDGAQIVLGSSDRNVKLWDASNGALHRILQGHKDEVWSVAYSPNGAQIASGSRDHTIRLWDAHSGAAGHTLKGHTDAVFSMVYSPNGAQIASSGRDKTVRLWDAGSGMLHHTLEGHTNSVVSTAYSSNGVQIASGSLDHTVRLWDVASGQCRAVIRDFSGSVLSVAWKGTPEEGDYLVTSSDDMLVRQWRVIAEGDEVQVVLCWISPHAGLTVKDMFIKGVEGLCEQNRALFRQRGANDGRGQSGVYIYRKEDASSIRFGRIVLMASERLVLNLLAAGKL